MVIIPVALLTVISATIPECELEFARLCSLRPQTVARAEIVRGFETLISENVGQEIAARSMLKIGSIFLLSDSSCELTVDVEESQVWFRKAAASARIGSDVWIEATSRVARHIRDVMPIQGDGLRECRRMLASIAPHVQVNSVESTKLEYEFFLLSVREGDLDGAENRAQNVLHEVRSLDASVIGQNQRFQLRLLAENCATLLIREYQRSNASDRLARVSSLRSVFAEFDSVRELADKVITSFPEYGFRRVGRLSLVFCINIVVVSVIALIFYAKRRREVSDTPARS